jgi:hypothetical protein
VGDKKAFGQFIGRFKLINELSWDVLFHLFFPLHPINSNLSLPLMSTSCLLLYSNIRFDFAFLLLSASLFISHFGLFLHCLLHNMPMILVPDLHCLLHNMPMILVPECIALHSWTQVCEVRIS